MGRAIYTSMSSLLKGCMEEKNNVWTARCCAALELRFRRVTSLKDFHDCFQQLWYTLSSRGPQILTGEECMGQCNRFHSQSSKKNVPRFFGINTAAEWSLLYVCADFYPFICICSSRKRVERCLQRLWGWKRSFFLELLYVLVIATYNSLSLDREGYITSGTLSTSLQCETF